MYKYERFRRMKEAKLVRDALRAKGFDPVIYKGHRHLVVQWFEN